MIGLRKDRQYMLTNELNGCIATVVMSEHPTGIREVGLTHFPPFMKDRNLKELEQLVTPEMKSSKNKAVFVYAQEKRSEETLPGLIEGIKKIFGEDVVIRVEKYKNEGEEDDGTLIIRIPTNAEGPISAHLRKGAISLMPPIPA